MLERRRSEKKGELLAERAGSDGSLMPLLGTRIPGERVVLKVRRGEEYLPIPMTLGRRQPTGSRQ